MPLALLAFAILASSSTLAAQPAVRALPRVCTDAYGRSTGFGTPSTSFRAQYWYSADNLPVGTPIFELGIRLRENLGANGQTRTIEILVDNSTRTFGGLSPTFASNLGPGTTTFFANRAVNFAPSPPSTDPNLAATWFPGDNLLVFAGPHLLVDFKGGASSTAGTAPNDGLLIQAPGALTAHLDGSPSCGGLLQASYAGGAVQLVATGLVPNTLAAFHIGAENVLLGTLPLPLDLSVIGMTGCHLATPPFATAQRVADANGVAALSLPVAISPTETLTVSAQVFHYLVPVPQSLADIASTNAVHSAIGYAGLCNTTYAPSSTATTATQGPNPVNSAIVLLVR